MLPAIAGKQHQKLHTSHSSGLRDETRGTCNFLPPAVSVRMSRCMDGLGTGTGEHKNVADTLIGQRR